MNPKSVDETGKRPGTDSHFGYNPEENRFGDADLSTPFIWKKKWARKKPDLKGTKLREYVTGQLKQRKTKISSEIREVKELRKKRLVDKEDMDRMREDIQRQVERENFGLLNQKEEEFHRSQVRQGALIRVESDRENAFDNIFKVKLFAAAGEKAVSAALGLEPKAESIRRMKRRIVEGGSGVREEHAAKRIMKKIERLENVLVLKNPFEVISTADKRTLKTLVSKESGRMLLLEEDTSFWETILFLSEFFLQRREDYVKKEAFKILSFKTIAELDHLAKDIEGKILPKHRAGSSRSREAVDHEYWEGVLPFVRVFKAKISLNETYLTAVDTRNKLKSVYEKELEKTSFRSKKKSNFKKQGKKEKRKHHSQITNLEPCIHIAVTENEKNQISKCKISLNQFFGDLNNKRRTVLRDMRSRGIFVKPINDKIKTVAEELLEKESEIPLEEDEEVFSSKDVKTAKVKEYWWQEKFRPRKPLYFNRIKTGYDWNKYNRSHYDSENPPPKIVQGYKFNVFYPDLIDIKTAPTYSVTECEANSDYAVLKFKAGPPYEDIAFKIVNKDWNVDRRKGFKSTFSNGVMQLFFNFQRYAYRR